MAKPHGPYRSDPHGFDTNHPLGALVAAMRGWDAVRSTPDCPHCGGSGIAPGDGRTECGFCEDRPDKNPDRTRPSKRHHGA